MLRFKGEKPPYKAFIQKSSLGIVDLMSLKKMSDLEGLDSIPEIKELWISKCGLTELDALEYFPKLERLEIHETNLTNLKGIENLTRLKILDASNNNKIKVLSYIEKLSNLEKLFLTECSIEKISLSKSKMALNHLKFIRLEKNKLKTFPEILVNLPNLEKLYLDKNNLSYLPDSFVKLSKLWKLHLSHNKFSTFPDSITKLPSLKSIDISNNYLSKIPESIGNLTTLERLYIQNPPIKSLPNSIGNLINLRLLFPGRELETLPASILNLPNLQNFIINRCYKLDINSKIVRKYILSEIKGRPRAVFDYLSRRFVRNFSNQDKKKILNFLFKALRNRKIYKKFLSFFETPDLLTKRIKKGFVRNIILNGDRTDIKLAANSNLISYLSDKELIKIIIDNLLIVPQCVIEFTHYFTLNHFMDLFSKEYYRSIIAFIQNPSRRDLLNSLNKEKLSNFIESPKIDFFQIIVNTLNYFERDVERKIDDLKESDSRNQDINVDIQKLKFKEYEFYWGNNRDHGSDLYYFLDDIKEIAPIAFKKEIIRKFEEDKTEIVNLILQMDLYWDFSSNDIDLLRKDVKKNILKHLIRIWGDEKFFPSGSYLNDYMYDTIGGFLKGDENTIKFIFNQMIFTFETGSSEQAYTIFLFAVINNCIEIFDLSSISVIRGFMRLTEQTTTDNYEMYYTDLREKLFKIGLEKRELIFENIIQILRENHLKDLKSLIKLHWLKFFNLNQLKLILDDKKINFTENITTLLLFLLNDKEKEYDVLEDFIGLLYNVLLVENRKYINFIVDNLKERIVDIINFFFSLLDYRHNKSIRNFIIKLIKTFSNNLLDYKSIEVKILFPILIKLKSLDMKPFNEVLKEDITKRFAEMKIDDIKYILSNNFLKEFNKIELRNLIHKFDWDKICQKMTPNYNIGSFLKILIKSFYIDEVVTLDKSNRIKFKDNLAEAYIDEKFTEKMQFLEKNEYFVFSSREDFLQFILENNDLRVVINLEKKYKRKFPIIEEGNTETPSNAIYVKNKRIIGLKFSHLNTAGFPEYITRLNSLRFLFFCSIPLFTLPRSIRDLKSLETLICINNTLLHLPESIGDLKKLRKINLMDNELTDLPSSLFTLQSLKDVNLKNNKVIIPRELIEKLEKRDLKITI